MSAMWLNKILGKNKNTPKDLKDFLAKGFISKEEFFRFTIVQKQASLDKAKKELLNFLKKKKR